MPLHREEGRNLICNALVPRTLALSYLVIYGVVLRLSSGIFLSFSLVGFFWPAFASPVTTFLFSVSPFWPSRAATSSSRAFSSTSGAKSSAGSSGS